MLLKCPYWYFPVIASSKDIVKSGVYEKNKEMAIADRLQKSVAYEMAYKKTIEDKLSINPESKYYQKLI